MVRETVVQILLCVTLSGCSRAGTQLPPAITIPVTPGPSSVGQPIQNDPTRNPTAIPPAAYLAPQSPITPLPYISPAITRAPYPGPLANKVKPYLTPTPVVRWNTDVTEVSWNNTSTIIQPGWISNTIARLALYPTKRGDEFIQVDISTGKNAQPVTTSLYSNWRIFSPQHTYVIECDGGMKMIRINDNSLVSQTPLLPPLSPGVVCSTFIQWAPDESIASFVAADKSVYVWHSNGTEPRKVMSNASSVFTAWSPDSQKLTMVKSVTNSHIGTIDVTDKDGQILHEFQFQAGDSAVVGWFTNEVLASYSQYTAWYYDVQSGQFLFSWTIMPTGDGIWHQLPQVSPDGRWVFIDQGNKISESALYPIHYIVQKKYNLYDVRTKTSYLLLNQPGNYLSFAGWNKDSSKMYVVSRPAESDSISDPSTPFGLLSYDLKSHQFELLFKEAVQVVWNNDKSWAFVVFTARDEKGKLGLAGGLWKISSQTLVGRWWANGQMIYRDPATDTFFNPYPGIAWSQSGREVAVSDGFGQVKLLNIEGTERVLTRNMSSRGVALIWSPDDQYLLVEEDGRAWFISVSKL